jgi:hypothetical protein
MKRKELESAIPRDEEDIPLPPVPGAPRA